MFSFSETSPCLINNGGCSYLCITSLNGRICACPRDMSLAEDNSTCLGMYKYLLIFKQIISCDVGDWINTV